MTETVDGEATDARRRRGSRLSLRAFLLLVVALPTAGLLLLAAVSAVQASSQRDAAMSLREQAETLAQLIEARAAVADEETVSAVISIGLDLGADVEQLSRLYGVDYASELKTARQGVDQDPTLGQRPELVDEIDRLRDVRAEIDAGTATFDVVNEAVSELTGAIDDLWMERFVVVREEVESATLSGTVGARLDALRRAFVALSAASDRAVLSSRLLVGDPEQGDLLALLEATTRFADATRPFPERLGQVAATAWRDHVADPAVERFEETLDSVVDSALAGETSVLARDPFLFGEAFVDGAPWGRGLSRLVQAAGEDLRRVATDQAEAATRELQVQLAVAAVLTLLSVAGALAFAVRVTRPVQRLEDAAHQIHQGRFDLEPIEPSGPRELVDTAIAFNDMASTLAAVEAHAVALADDADAPVLSDQLRGRTGRALQVALNRLRSSIQVAEERRRELQRAATHDALTGVLNREAAFEMIGRDLARASREGGAVAVLFLDMDGLKQINDRFGHAAGDDALRLTAEALRSASRASDVLARFGGDEFLVAGVFPDGRREVEEMAERIRETIADQAIASADGPVGLRCSIGAAIAQSGSTAESLVNEADRALYEAKRRGGNQVAWQSETGSDV